MSENKGLYKVAVDLVWCSGFQREITLISQF